MNLANIISDNYPTMPLLCQALQEKGITAVSNLTYPINNPKKNTSKEKKSRKIGPKLGEKLVTYLLQTTHMS